MGKVSDDSPHTNLEGIETSSSSPEVDPRSSLRIFQFQDLNDIVCLVDVTGAKAEVQVKYSDCDFRNRAENLHFGEYFQAKAGAQHVIVHWCKDMRMRIDVMATAVSRCHFVPVDETLLKQHFQAACDCDSEDLWLVFRS